MGKHLKQKKYTAFLFSSLWLGKQLWLCLFFCIFFHAHAETGDVERSRSIPVIHTHTCCMHQHSENGAVFCGSDAYEVPDGKMNDPHHPVSGSAGVWQAALKYIGGGAFDLTNMKYRICRYRIAKILQMNLRC